MFEQMFENAGSKIKMVAKVYFVIMVLGAIGGGIAFMAEDDEFILLGLLTMFVGALIAWISSLFLYGFGELVENSTLIRQKMGATAPNPAPVTNTELPRL